MNRLLSILNPIAAVSVIWANVLQPLYRAVTGYDRFAARDKQLEEDLRQFSHLRVNDDKEDLA